MKAGLTGEGLAQIGIAIEILSHGPCNARFEEELAVGSGMLLDRLELSD